MKPVLVLGLLGILSLTGCLPRPAPPSALGPSSPTAPVSKDLGQVQDFVLQDSENRDFRFFENSSGYSLVSFVFTHCSDVCPYVLLKMKAARDLLGPASKSLRLVAVTVDPERDTPDLLKAYLKDLGLESQVHFLTGKPAEVEKVWKNFGVQVQRAPDHQDTLETSQNAEALGMHMPMNPEALAQKGLGQDSILLARRVVGQYVGGYDVLHTSPFWIVAPSGKILGVVNYDQTPAQLAEAIRKHLP